MESRLLKVNNKKERKKKKFFNELFPTKTTNDSVIDNSFILRALDNGYQRLREQCNSS